MSRFHVGCQVKWGLQRGTILAKAPPNLVSDYRWVVHLEGQDYLQTLLEGMLVFQADSKLKKLAMTKLKQLEPSPYLQFFHGLTQALEGASDKPKAVTFRCVAPSDFDSEACAEAIFEHFGFDTHDPYKVTVERVETGEVEAKIESTI